MSLKEQNIQAVTTPTVGADSLSSVLRERKWIFMPKIEMCVINEILLVITEVFPVTGNYVIYDAINVIHLLMCRPIPRNYRCFMRCVR